MSKLLFEGEQKRSVFVSVPLNVNELLLLAQMAELLQLVSFYLTHTCIENIIILLCSIRSQTMMERSNK